MKILVRNGRVVDPASGRDEVGDVAIAQGRIEAIGQAPSGFAPDEIVDASGCIVAPGLVDLAVRLREPGHEHEGMLQSELAAAVAGGVTTLVCPPDTDPVLDEPGLVQMLRVRSERLQCARVLPLGALTRGLAGAVLTEMTELTEAGCVGFSQAGIAIADTQVMLRALQYAATYGYTVWLRPQDPHLGSGVAANGPFATRMGLAGVPVAAETIALHTIFELVRATGARVHLCRLSSAQGVALVREARRQSLPVTCDVSANSLHLIDNDIGYFDSRMRLDPVLRQQADRAALRAGLADGTIDALVSDHSPIAADEKALPFAQAQPGATGLELLLGLALKWGEESGTDLRRVLATITSGPPCALHGAHSAQYTALGRLGVGAPADLCVFDPRSRWTVTPGALRSQGQHTPFAGYELPGQVRCTIASGRVAYRNPQHA